MLVLQLCGANMPAVAYIGASHTGHASDNPSALRLIACEVEWTALFGAIGQRSTYQVTCISKCGHIDAEWNRVDNLQLRIPEQKAISVYRTVEAVELVNGQRIRRIHPHILW